MIGRCFVIWSVQWILLIDQKEGLDLRELMKHLKEKYQHLKKTNGWDDKEMALTSSASTANKKTKAVNNNSRGYAICVERLGIVPLIVGKMKRIKASALNTGRNQKRYDP